MIGSNVGYLTRRRAGEFPYVIWESGREDDDDDDDDDEDDDDDDEDCGWCC